MTNWAAQGLWCPLGRPEGPLEVRHRAENDGAARSDHALEKENVEKAAIILLQITFVPNTPQTAEDLPQDLQISEGRQMSLLNSLKCSTDAASLSATLVTVYS